jgi:hypothetical protein
MDDYQLRYPLAISNKKAPLLGLGVRRGKE